MEIAPVSGVTIIELPDGKRAIVQVDVVGPKTARKIAVALALAAFGGIEFGDAT